jgi:hypothetical protein
LPILWSIRELQLLSLGLTCLKIVRRTFWLTTSENLNSSVTWPDPWSSWWTSFLKLLVQLAVTNYCWRLVRYFQFTTTIKSVFTLQSIVSLSSQASSLARKKYFQSTLDNSHSTLKGYWSSNSSVLHLTV